MSGGLQIALVGDASRCEFHEACKALEEVACVTLFADLSAAVAALEEGPFAPHGIVLVQTTPSQFSAAAVERLRAAAPLARLFALLGNWCEGEPRSGRPLPGVVRFYWHEAAVRFRQEFPDWSTAGSAWSLPITAGEEERLLASVAVPLPSGEGLVALWTRRREMADLLADACRRGGFATAWLHPRQAGGVRGAVAAIFDADALDAAVFHELQQLAADVAPARVLVLLGAPRTQDVRLAKTVGATVTAKPFRIDELLAMLRTLIAETQPSQW